VTEGRKLASTVTNEENETTSRPPTVTSTATSHCIVMCLQCVAVYCSASTVCCSVLQCGPVWSSVLQCVYSVLQCVAVCCSVLQCVAVCCSVLQCVAVCCSVLQCVYSVLQCVAVLQCVYSVLGDYSRKTTRTLTLPRVCLPLSHTHTSFKPLKPSLSLFLYLVVCISMSLSHTHSIPLSL